MATVVADGFWYLEPSVDEIVDDGVLAAFTNQVVKDDNLLVVHRKLFKWKNLIPWRLDGLVTSFGVDFCGKVL